MIEQIATYSPEDNKLRLYIGHVPREEYLKLRAEGWKALHKQRENGGGDFVAIWTPARRDTALAYGGGVILDEDQGPAERAADRAERFGSYRDKRTDEANKHADRYDSGPTAHGFQNQARAERAAARHDRIGDRATDAWSKAEYWQRRTAGVISHALYKSTPAVRMGRIKILEADLRRYEQSPSSYPNWIEHAKLRLAYENQMCEAAGGRAALVEMIPGGFLGSHQIVKVNKSAVTSQVVSVCVMAKHKTYKDGQRVEVFGPVLFNIERLQADAYRPPTPEELTTFTANQKAEKEARPKIVKPPLINPTDEDAERLQAIWNDRVKVKWDAKREKDKFSYTPEFKPQTVCRINQATYSANSKGTYGKAKTERIEAGGKQVSGYLNRAKLGNPVCLLRVTSGEIYMADRVIVIIDKPQKPLPNSIWQQLQPETVAA